MSYVDYTGRLESPNVNKNRELFFDYMVDMLVLLLILYLTGNITCLGPHSLTLQVLASDSMTNLPPSSFPKHKIKFTVTGIVHCD